MQDRGALWWALVVPWAGLSKQKRCAGECETLSAELQEAQKANADLMEAQERLQQDIDRLQVEAADAAAALASTR